MVVTKTQLKGTPTYYYVALALWRHTQNLTSVLVRLLKVYSRAWYSSARSPETSPSYRLLLDKQYNFDPFVSHYNILWETTLPTCRTRSRHSLKTEKALRVCKRKFAASCVCERKNKAVVFQQMLHSRMAGSMLKVAQRLPLILR